MSRRNKKPQNRRCRKSLLNEQLEPRVLLAGDATAPLLPDETVLTSSLDESVVASTATSDPVAETPAGRSTVIPTTTAPSRSFDGTGNNLANPLLGSVGELLLRVARSEYGDGISTPAGADRPSPREISNVLVAQDGDMANDRQLSAFIFAWGQFIDHDIDLTEPPEDDREAFPIPVPAGDPLFDPSNTGTQQIGFFRSRYKETTGTGVDNPREQFNQITAWIDGSMVYGSELGTADSLRTLVGGKLRTSDGDLPPVDAEGNFVAGDVRANENIELTSLHTLFVREHNWWAEEIARDDPSLGDEEIYQRARAIVIAEIQAITFNEFLPALLGRGAIDAYQGYDLFVDPSIANEFSTAAFRLHTMINDEVGFIGNDGRAVHDEVELAEAFFNPDLLRETGADSILKYLASTQAQEIDNQIVGSLRNFLFGQPGQGGFDLAALNIQRGRDHGLADYNAVREAYGLARVESFAEISSDSQVQQSLESLYGSVDNIDLWVGALAEDHVRGASVGELVQTIVADQFSRLRDGDRFWYESIFTGESLARMQATSLADVITRNMTVDNLQANVFYMRAEVSGRVYVEDGGRRRDGDRESVGGATVELLDDEGEVVATTVTDRRGRFSFFQMHETGDYTVRIVVPDG